MSNHDLVELTSELVGQVDETCSLLEALENQLMELKATCLMDGADDNAKLAVASASKHTLTTADA